MIQITKCPLRISLAGGASDLQGYLEKYEHGEVISFTPDLYTYITLKKALNGHYKIVYSRVEEVLTIAEIKNDIAREVLAYFDMPPVEISYTADIPSSGSGLASSTSYLINLIYACLHFQGKEMHWNRVGELALMLERNFNPLTGYQDVYGCLIGGFKLLTFNTVGLESATVINSDLFKKVDFHLIPTGLTRSSTEILETIDYEQVHKAVPITNEMFGALLNDNYSEVIELVREGWELKKKTSPHILNPQLGYMESRFSGISDILAWRLVGAGKGGYFLALTKKDSDLSFPSIKVNLDNTREVKTWTI